MLSISYIVEYNFIFIKNVNINKIRQQRKKTMDIHRQWCDKTGKFTCNVRFVETETGANKRGFNLYTPRSTVSCYSMIVCWYAPIVKKCGTEISCQYSFKAFPINIVSRCNCRYIHCTYSETRLLLNLDLTAFDHVNIIIAVACLYYAQDTELFLGDYCCQIMLPLRQVDKQLCWSSTFTEWYDSFFIDCGV